MLDEICNYKIDRKNSVNASIFSLDGSYGDALDKKNEAKERWEKLEPIGRPNLDSYEKTVGVPDIKDKNLLPSKNTYLLMNEIDKRLIRQNPIVPFVLESLDFEAATMEIAESLENIEEIKSLYVLRKASTCKKKDSGIASGEARKIKHCFTQGRDLFFAAKNGSLMVKPLNFFYSLTAYSYGVIILNHPLRYRKDMLPGSHGMSYSSQQTIQFGGDSPKGTFSDLICAFPTQSVNIDGVSFDINCFESIIEFYKTKFDVSIGCLMSLIPEMSEYYRLSTGNESRCFPLEIVNSTDRSSYSWDFHIGNGERRPSLNSILNAFDGFSVRELHGKTVITVPVSESSKIRASIYTDIRGGLWFIDNPFFPVALPEIAVHFLICGAFSNIMRYRPDEWGELLLNEVNAKVSLVTRHYFSSLERKFMIMTMRTLSRYNLYVS